MKRDRILRLLLVPLILAAIAAPARAQRRVLATAGGPNRAVDAPCFSRTFGAISNSSCVNAMPQWCVSLPIDSPSPANISLQVGADVPPNFPEVLCLGQTTDQFGRLADSSGWRSMPSANHDQVISIPPLALPPAGAAYVCCVLPMQGSIGVISW
jgi:hypothetical protein